MPDSYLTDLLKRNVACDKEAMVGVSGFYSSRSFPYSQEGFPYMVNRLGAKSTPISPEDIFAETRLVMKRLVVGHVDEGFKGQINDKLSDWMVLIEDYYRDNTMLVSALFPDEADYIHPQGVSIGIDTGLAFFINSGIGVSQIGVEFTLSVPIIRENF